MKLNYNHTLICAYTGYVVQAIVANLAPLLLVTFQREFSLSLVQLSIVISLNFVIQFGVDYISATFADKIGYRRLLIFSHIFAAAGLLGLGILPFVTKPLAGILISTVLYAIGGGMIEVIISPLIEALPLKNKASAMSLLHSFYCWGQMAVVLFSTLFFNVAGLDKWRFLPMLWAIIPIVNCFFFTKVPICQLNDDAPSMSKRKILTTPRFWVFAVIMTCAGAAELGMSQWASAFAEEGLGVSKTMGDLLGPCMFALCMGAVRALFGKFGHRINLAKFMLLSGALCICGYLIAALCPNPFIALGGCALCGLSVAIMWPGALSMASKAMPTGGTALFGYMAFAGDVGCASGPYLVGLAGSIRSGLLLSVIFPAVLIAAVMLNHRYERKTSLKTEAK